MEIIKWILLVIIFGIGGYSTYQQCKKRNWMAAVLSIISVLSLSIVSDLIIAWVEPFLPYPEDPPAAVLETDSTLPDMSSMESDNGNNETDDALKDMEHGETEHQMETVTVSSDKDDDNTINTDSYHPENYLNDITGKVTVSGSIVREEESDRYTYIAPTDGTYHFSSDLSSGGEIRISMSGENDELINYGVNELSIDLEAKKEYILSIEYQNGPCDYIVNIGVPAAVTDITESQSASGNISYPDQKDKYYYTAPVEGIYRFDTDRTAGGEVRIELFGENGNSISYGTNALSIVLEEGKTYILSIEYLNGSCEYKLNIGVPQPISDITEKTVVSGNITYQDQKDRYRFTASVSGTYRFDTDLSAGSEVRVQILGENDVSIDYGTNSLTIDLEEGKTYILAIEYRNGPCSYTVNIGIPNAITDITGVVSISGNISYQDQKDRYRFVAPTSGTYHFGTDLSAGGEVRIRISGENGNSLYDRINALSIDLEAGKTYILSIEYQNGICDYTVNIGVPIPMADITGFESISGAITYEDQKDQYSYTAMTSGTYHFATNLSSNEEILVRISGTNGNSLDDGINELTIDLEAGQTYILSIEYRNTFCMYQIFISAI